MSIFSPSPRAAEEGARERRRTWRGRARALLLAAAAATPLGCQRESQPQPQPQAQAQPQPQPQPQADAPEEAPAPAPTPTQAPAPERDPPEIRVDAPRRAAAVPLQERVTIVYAVEDASALGEVTINGDALDEAARAGGRHEMVPRPGLNLITIEAADVHGNKRRHVQGFYAAAAYHPVESWARREAMIPEGLTLWLGQEAIDAGGAAQPRDGARPRDLATVLELLLASLKSDALIGAEVAVDNKHFKGVAKVTSVKRGQPPEVAITVDRGRLGLEVTLRDIEVSSRFDGAISLAKARVDATAHAEALTIAATLDVSLVKGGEARVRSRDLEVRFQGLRARVDNKWGSAVNWIIAMYEDELARQIAGSAEARLLELVDAPLSRALDGIAVDQRVALPSLFGAAQGAGDTLELRSELESLELHPAARGRPGGVQVNLRASATSVRRVQHELSGSIVRRRCGRSPMSPPEPEHPVEIGARLDLINQLLTALWQTGMFKGSLELTAEAREQLPLLRMDQVAVDIELPLPPVLLDCNPSRALELQIGDAALTLRTVAGGEATEIELHVSAAARVRVTASAADDRDRGPAGPGTLALAIEPAHVLEFDVTAVRINGEAAPAARAAALEGLLKLVSQRMLDLCSGTLAQLPLPVLDLSALAPQLPGATVIAPAIAEITPKQGALRIGGRAR